MLNEETNTPQDLPVRVLRAQMALNGDWLLVNGNGIKAGAIIPQTYGYVRLEVT